MYARRALLFTLLVVALTGGVRADIPAKPVTLSDQFPGIEFRNSGPFRVGRVTAIADALDARLRMQGELRVEVLRHRHAEDDAPADSGEE